MRIEGVSTLNTPEPAPKEIKVQFKEQQGHKPGKKADKPQQQKPQVDEARLIKTIESANKEIRIYNRSLKFSIHEKTKEIMVKVIDTDTKEVVREIPPEEILDMVARLWELAGILVDEKV